MTNRRPLAASVVCPLGQLSQQFYVGLDRFVVRDVFLSVFLVDLLLEYRAGKSRRSRLDVLASLGSPIQHKTVLLM